MQINNYARGTKDENYLGYVQRGCGLTVEETSMIPVLDSFGKTIEIKYIYLNILAGGVFFQIILICLGTALLLQRWMPVIADHSLQCSKTYSMLWAVLTSATVFWIVIAAVNTFSIVSVYSQGHRITTSTSALLVYIPAVLEFPVAVSFAKKYNFAIPCVYLAPAKLLCCGKKSKASSLIVRIMFLWMALNAIQMASVNGTFIVIAIAAAPFPVITNVMVIIFTVFCLVHLFAVILTFPCLRRETSSTNTTSRIKIGSTAVQAITFLFLLVTMFCFAMAGAGFSYIINVQSNQGGILLIGKAILPLALGVTGLALRRLSNMWWSSYGPVTTKREDEGLMAGRDGYEAV